MEQTIIKHKENFKVSGLTEREVVSLKASGKVNNSTTKSSRSYYQILKENLFTFINVVFLTISLSMFFLERYGDSLIVVIVIFGGVLVNIYQEIWTKKKLDKIALLNRFLVSVIRDGNEKKIKPNEIVLGDIMIVQPGDQFVVDGIIVGEGTIEVDESFLTGESEPIAKMAGDTVYSGSFCISGTAYYKVTQVGINTFASQIMKGAKTWNQVLTPLQREINLVIRIFFLIASFLWLLTGISYFSRFHTLQEIVQRSAVIAGLVPAGLLLAITLSYGLSAVKMAKNNVLIQQANAVESLSNIDILCLDKTGTITTNQLNLETIYPLNTNSEKLSHLLGIYAASTTAGNKTIEAIASVFPEERLKPIASVPFSSSRCWSAIAFDDKTAGINGVYVLGAPFALASFLSLSSSEQDYITKATKQGLRVLLFAYSPDVNSFLGKEPQLPSNLVLQAILGFSEELRPGVANTLAEFIQAGIEIKIISGDNPLTVATLAKQAGLQSSLKIISGQELALMDDAQLASAASEYNIFGRINPQQKASLVQSLRQQGHYVAMIGDGVNDVLSLKQANLAIALFSGSSATRGVADIILLKNSLAALPEAFKEGQRVRQSIQDIMKLFMVRTFCVTLLIFATAIVMDSFPLENKQSALVTLIGVGFPTMFLPLWAKPSKLNRDSLVRSILHFVLPATLTLTIVSLFVYLLYLVIATINSPVSLEFTEFDYSLPRSALVTILIMGELLLIPFLKPPTKAWVGGEPLSGDWRYSFVALVLLLLYFIIVSIPSWCQFFELSYLGVVNYLFIGLVALLWCLILRAIWRSRFLDLFLGIDLK